MVRTVTLGLLISGIMPIAPTNSVTLSEHATPQIATSIRSSCQKLGKSSICSNNTSIRDSTFKSRGYSNLSLRGITQSLFPKSLFSLCEPPSTPSPSNQWLKFSPSSWKTDLSLSSLGTIVNPSCSLSGKQSNRQPVSLQPTKTTTITPEQDNNHNYIAHPKFPSLSRSSLIVAFPQENSSFMPQDTRLANPAPETKRIASPFGWRTRPYSNQLQFHQGIDYGAPFGSSVVAIGNGIVTKIVTGCADFGSLFCGGQLGNWIEIDHGNGLIGTYGHLKLNSITVKAGERVGKNQSIAQVGSSGWSTGAHLDFRLKVNGHHENPAKYVMNIELKPEKPLVW